MISIFSTNLIRKIIYLGITLISILSLSYILSERTPFHGDEFYTLDITKVHKPVPYQYFVSKIINSIAEVKPSHTFILRLTSIFFTCLGVILLFLFFPKTKLELFLLSILIITNPFILSMSILFRYYSYYFMSSILTFIFLVILFNRFKLKTQIILGIIGSIGSIFHLYILNALQFGFALLRSTLIDLVKNLEARIILISIFFIVFIVFLVNPQLIWQLFIGLNITGHASVDPNSAQILGFTKSTFIKPFYAVYQMIFGLDIAPTYSFYFIVMFIFLAIIFLLILWRIYFSEKQTFIGLLFYHIIPFFVVYYFFQTLSLPGATQLESKHGMLIFPLILYLAIKSHNYLSPKINIVFIIVLVSAQLMGMVKTFGKQNINWEKIATQSHLALYKTDDSALLMDGRSREIYNFFSQSNKTSYPVHYTWQNIDSLKSKLNDKTKLVLLLNDYKSYTSLSLRQNWASRFSSENRFSGLESLLVYLNYHFKLKDSYVSYPTFFYILEKKETPNDYQTFSVWQHHLKDLKLPIQIESSMLLSSVLIAQNEVAELQNDSTFIFNLENISNIHSLGDTIGIIESGLNKTNIIYGKNSWDIFSDYHGIEPNNDFLYHSWRHTPLISGSINYTGSYFSHNLKLYKIKLNHQAEMITVSNLSKSSKIRVWVKDELFSN